MHPEWHYKRPCKRKTEEDSTNGGEESSMITDADAAQLALQMEEGITSQGVQVSSRRWTRQGIDSPLKLLEGAQLCQHLDFSPVMLVSDFLPPELWENKFLLF